MIVNFPNKGVSFTIPESLRGLEIQFLPKPSPWVDAQKDESQYLISYELLYRGEEVFKDPIIIEAKFTERQLKCVDNDPEALKLEFKFDGDWVTKEQEIYQLKEDKWVGSIKVALNNPGDPMVAWGP
jgi:hypothetical protein